MRWILTTTAGVGFFVICAFGVHFLGITEGFSQLAHLLLFVVQSAIMCWLTTPASLETEIDAYKRIVIVIPMLCSAITVAFVLIMNSIQPDALVAVAVSCGTIAPFLVTFYSGIVIVRLTAGKRREKARNASVSCQHCGYRIDNIPGPNCPECGTRFASIDDQWSPKDMFKK